MKTLTLKRTLAFVMVLAMALSLAGPAAAAGNEFSTTVAGKYQEATIDVAVPTTANVIINPLGMPYKLNDATSGTITNQQIVTTAPQMIQNLAEVPLDVSVKLSVNTSETLYLCNDLTATKAASGEDSVITKFTMNLKVFKTDLTPGEATGDSLKAAYAKLYNEATTPAIKVTPGYSTDAYQAGEVEATGGGSGQLKLKEASGGEAVAGGIALFLFDGVVAKNAEFTDAHTFTSKIVWTFVPTTMS